MERIHTKKNLILDSKGRPIKFKGVSIADPFWIANKDKMNPIYCIKQAIGLGANIIRVPIHPGYWQCYKNYAKKYLDPIIEQSQKQGVYILLDWHAIGNPVSGETRTPEKIICGNKEFLWNDVNIEAAKNALKHLARRYKNYRNILYEIFNEPAPGERVPKFMKIQPLYWKDWKLFAEQLIDIIRKENPNSVIVVGGTKWAYDLSGVLKNPIKRDNIVYSIHPYPIHKAWDYAFGNASKKYPIIVTECGFKRKTESKFMRGSKTGYAKPLFKFLKNHNIGWVAWCFHHKWGPAILESWKPLKFTEWGEVVKEQLSKS